MPETSTQPGEAGLYTSEYKEVDKLLSSHMQQRLRDWKGLDAACRNLADVVINTNYFRPARLGLLSHDRYHPNSWGHYFIMSRVWEALQTNSLIRETLPALKDIRKLGDFTDFGLLWSSVVKLNVGRDGYRVARIVDIVTLIRTDALQLPGEGWHDIPFTHDVVTREIDEAPGSVITGNRNDAIRIADQPGYSSFKVSGFCTLNAKEIGKYHLSFSRFPAAQSHDRAVGDAVIMHTDTLQSIPLFFESIWLPIQTGGETLFLTLNTPGDAEVDGSQGIGVQIELRERSKEK